MTQTSTRIIDLSHQRGPIEGQEGNRLNITAVGFVHAPASWTELQNWIDAHAPEDRPHLTTAAIMAWNLAAKIDAHNEATEAQRNGVAA